jgi:serine/threonine-protein kinase
MSTKQRYRVVEKIDMGGMAEIFRGFATTSSLEGIEKEVAIKRVLPQLTKNRKFVAMFIDEARLSMHLNHANIVQVFDVGRADDTYFIVMEFVDGYNLRRIFQRANELNMRLPVGIACFIMLEVCKGLQHAHDKKDAQGQPLRIVHRDVSPPNVLISKSGEVKITDFGLAKAVTQLELTDPGVVKGKFSYLSPEAAEGRPLDHRADLFAVGTVLFELLTNRRLFLGKTDVETVDLVRKAEVPGVSKLNPDVSKDLERILDKALAKDPRRRYTSAGEMANALADYLFKGNQRVTSIDLADYVRSLFEEGKDDLIGERIDALIQEEVINMSSLGIVAEAFSSEGSRPLRLEEFSPESLGIGRIPVQAIWRDTAQVAASAQKAAQMGTSSDILRLEDSSSSSRLVVTSGVSTKTVVVVGIALFLAVAAIGYFVYHFIAES